MGEGYTELLLLTDNYWIIAMSPAELKCMARAWNELLEKLDCASHEKKLCGVRRHLTVWRRQSRWITVDGHFVKEIAEREVVAWRSFSAIRHLLCDNKVALRHRLRFLSSCVASSMYWCFWPAGY